MRHKFLQHQVKRQLCCTCLLIICFGSFSAAAAAAGEKEVQIILTEDEVRFLNGDGSNIEGSPLKLFNRTLIDGDTVIAPGFAGTETLSLINISDSVQAYTLDFISDNQGRIPLEFKIRKDGDYVFGDQHTGERFDLTCSLSGLIDPKKEIQIIVEWCWPEHLSEESTALGRLAVQQEVRYTASFSLQVSKEEQRHAAAGNNSNHTNNRRKATATSDNLYYQESITLLLLSLIILFYSLFKKIRMASGKSKRGRGDCH